MSTETKNSNVQGTNESVKNELKGAQNDASAKSLKQSDFKKKVLESVAKEKSAPAKQQNKKEKTKKDNANVIAAKIVEQKYQYKFQSDSKLSAVDQKKKRSAIRRKLFSFADAIFIANKQKNTDKLNENIKAFKLFFTSTYVNQKLEVKSIFVSERDEKKVQDLNVMINTIKKSVLAKEFVF